MKKTQLIAIAALALAATFQTAAKAEDPINPVQGAVCNLYNLGWDGLKQFVEIAANLAEQPAAATFADTAGDFQPRGKKNNVESTIGMWTGWLKQEKAGTYTFLCQQYKYEDYQIYCIWINGKKCVEGGRGQTSFNIDLDAGFNSVKIVASNWESSSCGGKRPLVISYKRAGSLKDPMTFGPADMWYDDEE